MRIASEKPRGTFLGKSGTVWRCSRPVCERRLGVGQNGCEIVVNDRKGDKLRRFQSAHLRNQFDGHVAEAGSRTVTVAPLVHCRVIHRTMMVRRAR